MKQTKKINMTIIGIILIILSLTIFIVIKNSNKEKVKIGIIDSYISSETLKDFKIKEDINFTNCTNDTKNNHGKAIIKIIKNQCKQSDIYYASVLDEKNSSLIENVIQAIDWCIEQNVNIICMSFATPINNLNLEKSIEVATQKGIIITSACINLSSVDCYPAMYENVISVSEGANPKADIIKKNEAFYIQNNGKKEKKIGTSFSNAYVCGEIAKEFMKDNFDLEEIVKKLNNN